MIQLIKLGRSFTGVLIVLAPSSDEPVCCLDFGVNGVLWFLAKAFMNRGYTATDENGAS
jgi:hypothetical protein